MLKLNRPIAIAAGSVAIVAFGTTGVAVAAGSSPSGDGDQAAQDAACTATGISLTAPNINYDDETGVCTLDVGNESDSENED